jgi:type II secretory pathway pseudopilin PulG
VATTTSSSSDPAGQFSAPRFYHECPNSQQYIKSMKRKMNKNLMHDSRGFSLIEVLLGISIFMIGMLGVTALNISSLKSNTFSGNLSEATMIAASQIEELMAMDFDDIAAGGADGTDQDVDDDGMDDDDPDDTATDIDGKSNFGLDDIEANADASEAGVGKNDIYTVYWNVAENEPISTDPARTKTINVIVRWLIKDEPRQISMSIIRMKEE